MKAFLLVLILAFVQGLAELLPVSSSAHVIFAEHLMGLDPSSPEMTFLLVMLHTGTMFAVLFYFRKRWLALLRSPSFLPNLVLATAATGFLGLGLKVFLEKIVLEHLLHYPKGEVEHLFKILPLMGASLFAAGVLILFAGKKGKRGERRELTRKESIQIGLVQGLCLPFRGFSRSGATISLGLLQGIERAFAEEFSFALAVVLTPAVIFLELKRLLAFGAAGTGIHEVFLPAIFGMFSSFVAGLLALRWLSAWLENGKWHLFGYYCLFFSLVIFLYSFH